MNDLIRREDAFDALRTCYDTEAITYDNGNEYISYDQALDLMGKLPSAEPDVSFWKKRASEYESICANLASQLSHGTKFNHMVINENGIELSTQPDWNEMLVICDNCGHAIHVKRGEQNDQRKSD